MEDLAALDALFNLVYASTRALRAVDAQVQAFHGIATAELGILRAIDDRPGKKARPVELARTLHLTPSGITRALDRLESRGLVRPEADREDRRAVSAGLTAAGKTAVAEATATAGEAARRLLRRLSVGQIKQLERLLSEIG